MNVIKKIKDFDDLLTGYGDKNLLKEYREHFGNYYEDEEDLYGNKKGGSK